jgi:ankyrin repeat protein
MSDKLDFDALKSLMRAIDRNDKKSINDVKELLESNKRIPINYGEYGYTPLRMASYRGSSPKIVRMLIEYGALVGRKDETLYRNKMSPIFVAARENHLEVLNELIANGADPDAKGEDGRTPLMFAAWTGSVSMVKALLEGGADKYIKWKGSTALNMAKYAAKDYKSKGLGEVIRILEEAEAENALMESIVNNSPINDNININDIINTQNSRYNIPSNNNNSRKNLYPTPKLVPRRGTSLIRRRNMAALKGLPSEEELSMRFEGRTRRKKPTRGRSLTRSKRNTYKPVHRI